MTSVPDVLRSLGDRLQAGASVKAVFGDPIVVGDRTVVPIARVGYGFGGGGSDKAGGGGGSGIRPAGALEITAAGTRFIPFVDPVRLAATMALAVIIGIALGRRLALR